MMTEYIKAVKYIEDQLTLNNNTTSSILYVIQDATYKFKLNPKDSRLILTHFQHLLGER